MDSGIRPNGYMETMRLPGRLLRRLLCLLLELSVVLVYGPGIHGSSI